MTVDEFTKRLAELFDSESNLEPPLQHFAELVEGTDEYAGGIWRAIAHRDVIRVRLADGQNFRILVAEADL